MEVHHMKLPYISSPTAGPTLVCIVCTFNGPPGLRWIDHRLAHLVTRMQPSGRHQEPGWRLWQHKTRGKIAKQTSEAFTPIVGLSSCR